MRFTKVACVSVLVGIVLLLAISSAQAFPAFPNHEPSSPGVGTPTGGGEATLFLSSISPGAAASVTVDWVVESWTSTEGVAGATGDFVYLYQVETPAGNSAIFTPFIFTLSNLDFSKIVAGSVGIASGDSLDTSNALHPAGNVVANYPSLSFNGAEFEPGTQTPVAASLSFADPEPAANLINWFIIPGGVPADHQSPTLFFVATTPPIYGNGLVQDGAQWNNINNGADGVPIPTGRPFSSVSESSSLAIWGMLSLISVAVVGSRRFRSASPVHPVVC